MKTIADPVNWEEKYKESEAQNVELKALVKYYEEQFRLAQHRRFGSSSEKVHPEQLILFDEAEATADFKQPEPKLEQITYTRKKRQGKREEDLSGLPVEVIEHTLPESECQCPECGEPLHKMGCDTRQELTIIPAQVKVTEHKRYVYSCRHCEKHSDHVPIIKASMPEPVIKGSLASPSAVAHIMTQKYVMCVPLYRQEQAWQRDGVALNRQTMANWVIRTAQDWLTPVYERLRKLMLTRDVLHADESVLQVLKEPGRKANTNSYMWHYRTGGDAEDHIVLYEYQPTRSSAHPKRFLEGYKGYLHTDGYSAYHKLSPDIIVVGCWAHMRRKFEEVLRVTKPEDVPSSSAGQALKQLGELFRLERMWKDLPPDERYKRRLEESKPKAEVFLEWLPSLKELPKMAMGKAIQYALDQRPWLMNVYLDGRTELTNNRAENSIRPFVMGRKNWLFCNTPKGAHASSVVYSVIESAKANNLKPFEYLSFLLESVPNTSISRLDDLLPWGKAVPESCRILAK